MNRLWISMLMSLAATSGSQGGAPPPAPPKASGGTDSVQPTGGLLSALLPKALQKNPRLDFNILTEMSAEGRRLRRPTAQNPVFYIAQSGGMRSTGLGAERSLKGPTEESLQRMMERALAESHYHASSGPTQQPTLVIIYHFGSQSFQPPAVIGPPPAADGEGGGLPPPPTQPGEDDVLATEFEIRKALREKALLIGGAKFRREVVEAFDELDRIAGLNRTFVEGEGAAGLGGTTSAAMRDPFEDLRSRSFEHERLVDELFSNSFFVIASAYDHAALAKKERRLLWRTKMTVNSLGVNMLESLPPLIASAAPYLGRETPKPVVLTKRIVRGANVEIGTATVIEADAALPGKAPPAPKKE